MATNKTKQYALADFRDEMKSLESGATTTPIPLHVLLGEAVDVAWYFAKYWKTIAEGDTIVRHGLESVGSRLPASTGAEIMALTELAQDAQSRYRLSVRGPRGTDPVGRATYLASEIDAAIAFLFDDGIEDEKDGKLAAIRTAHADTGASANALAAELADYVKLASEHQTSRRQRHRSCALNRSLRRRGSPGRRSPRRETSDRNSAIDSDSAAVAAGASSTEMLVVPTRTFAGARRTFDKSFLASRGFVIVRASI